VRTIAHAACRRRLPTIPGKLKTLEGKILVATPGRLGYLIRAYERNIDRHMNTTPVRLKEYLKAIDLHVVANPNDETKCVVEVRKKDERREQVGEPLFVVHGNRDDAYYAQLCALLAARKKFFLTKYQNRVYLEPKLAQTHLDEEMVQIRIMGSAIIGSNCIPCTVKPNVYLRYVRPAVSAAPFSMKAVYDEYTKRTGDAYPGQVWSKAWVSTGKPQGLMKALESIVKDRLTIALPSITHLPKITTYYLWRMNWKPSKVLQVPPIDKRDYIDGITVPAHSKAGIVLCPTSIKPLPNGDRARHGPTTTKEKALPLERARMWEIVNRIIAQVRKGETPSFDEYPLIIASLAEKPEVRMEGDDPEKVRLIFIVSTLKILLDKGLFSCWHHYSRSKGGNTIGTKWRAGDAARFAKKFHADEPNRFWIHGDARKLDQSMKASVITLLTYMQIIIYAPDDELYKAAHHLAAWSGNLTGVKLVAWVDSMYRLIVGTMFSGDFNTSAIDTAYVDDSIIGFVLKVHDDLKRVLGACEAKRFWMTVTSDSTVWGIYGDDFIFSALNEWREWCNLRSLNAYWNEYWDIAVKMEASFECESFYTVLAHTVDADGRHHYEDRVVKEGVVFLKRRFIKWQTSFTTSYVLCWRKTEDYYARAGISGNEILDPSHAIVRIHGLLWDTQGTNDHAWNFLEDMCDIIVSFYPEAETQIKFLDKESRAYLAMVEYAKKLGMNPDDMDLTLRPSRQRVLQHFLPSRDPLGDESRLKYRALPHYLCALR